MMKRSFLPLFAICILVVLPSARADEAADLKKFEGDWKVEKMEVDAETLPMEFAQMVAITIAGEKLTMKAGGKDESITFKLSPNNKIEFTEKDGKKSSGIYKIDGDKLMFAFSEDPKNVPTELKTEKGKMQVMLVLVKAKK